MIKYIDWDCPFSLKNGRECGKKHRIAWDTKFDSPCDGESLYCPKHTRELEKKQWLE